MMAPRSLTSVRRAIESLPSGVRVVSIQVDERTYRTWARAARFEHPQSGRSVPVQVVGENHKPWIVIRPLGGGVA